MPEKEFYINDIDRENLFHLIAKNNGKILSEQRYSENVLEVVKSSERMFEVIRNLSVGFIVISDFYTFEPIIVTKNRFSEAPLYSINQRQGGPYISLSFYLGFADDATVRYKSTIVHHYAWFIHSDSDSEFQAPDELKEYYKKIVKFLNDKTKPRKINGKTYRIGKNILHELGLESPGNYTYDKELSRHVKIE